MYDYEIFLKIFLIVILPLSRNQKRNTNKFSLNKRINKNFNHTTDKIELNLNEF